MTRRWTRRSISWTLVQDIARGGLAYVKCTHTQSRIRRLALGYLVRWFGYFYFMYAPVPIAGTAIRAICSFCTNTVILHLHIVAHPIVRPSTSVVRGTCTIHVLEPCVDGRTINLVLIPEFSIASATILFQLCILFRDVIGFGATRNG